jgi:hypothetical protein
MILLSIYARYIEYVSRISSARLGGVAALGFVVMIVLPNVVAVPAGLPTVGTDTTSALAFFVTQKGVVGLTSAMGPLAWVLATVFGAAAVAVLWPADRERGEAWSLAGFAGLLLQNLTFTGVVATRLALASTAGHGDQTGAAALWALHEALFCLNGTFLALALVGLTVSGRRAGLVPRWHGTVGLLGAGLQFGSALLAPVVVDRGGPLGLLGLAGWLLWVVWLVAYGRTLLRLAPATDPRPAIA